MACSSPERIADTSIASGETTLEAAPGKTVISSFLSTSDTDKWIVVPLVAAALTMVPERFHVSFLKLSKTEEAIRYSSSGNSDFHVLKEAC